MVNNAACSVIKNTIPRGLGKKFLHKRNHPFLPPPPPKKKKYHATLFLSHQSNSACKDWGCRE